MASALSKYMAQKGLELPDTEDETPAQKAAKSMKGAFGSWTGNPKESDDEEERLN